MISVQKIEYVWQHRKNAQIKEDSPFTGRKLQIQEPEYKANQLLDTRKKKPKNSGCRNCTFF
jgi:hypothetical protein